MKWALWFGCLAVACGQNLESRLASASRDSVRYVGYEVAMQPGNDVVCGGSTFRQSKLLLDGPGRLRILFRVDHGKVEKLQLASEACQIDVGSQTLVMLPDVTGAESVAYLASRADDSSLLAISLHADPTATPRLISLARDPANPHRQRKAFFWLARSKDPEALRFIERILR